MEVLATSPLVDDVSEIQLKKLEALKLTSENADRASEVPTVSGHPDANEGDSDLPPASRGGKAEAVGELSLQGAQLAEKPKATKGELLASVGLGQEQLSEIGRDRLRTIAGVSDRLGLLTADKEAVLAAVTELREQQWSAEDTKAQLSAVLQKVKAQIEIIRKSQEELQQVTKRVAEGQKAEEESSNNKEQRKLRAEVKAQNYAQELEQLESKLAHTGFLPQLSHDALLQRSVKLTARQAEVEALRTQLGVYADLPPDFDAASKVFCAKQEQLQATNKKFEEGLAQL